MGPTYVYTSAHSKVSRAVRSGDLNAITIVFVGGVYDVLRIFCGRIVEMVFIRYGFDKKWSAQHLI